MGLQRTYGSQIPLEPVPPTFGGRLYRGKLALTIKGQNVFEHILCIILHDFPNLEYCPFIPPLCALVCHHAETADDALGMMVALVKSSIGRNIVTESKNKTDDERWAYFPVLRKDYKYMTRAFYHLLQKNSTKLYKFLFDLQSTDPEPLWMRWFTDIFLDVLPMPVVFRILDNYFLEGYKALFRFGYALLKVQQDKILKCPDVNSIFGSYSISPPDFQDLFKVGFGLTIKRPEITKEGLLSKHNAIAPIVESMDDMVETHLRYQRMNPKLRQASSILTEEMWIALWSWIPPKLRSSELELIYSTTKDGYHLMNLFGKVKGHWPTLLLIETMDKAVFGAYVSKPWPLDSDAMSSFSGNGTSTVFRLKNYSSVLIDFGVGIGETFLFTLCPYAKAYYWVGMMPPLREAGKEEEEAKFEEHVRDKASFFIRTTKQDITIGGGGSVITSLLINNSPHNTIT